MNLLTVTEVAAELRVSKGTVYEMCKTGNLPSIRVGMNKGSVRIPRDALEKWLRAKLQAEASTPEEMWDELYRELADEDPSPPSPPRPVPPIEGCCQDLEEIEVHGNWALWCERHQRSFNPHFIDSEWLGRTPRTGAVRPERYTPQLPTEAGN